MQFVRTIALLSATILLSLGAKAQYSLSGKIINSETNEGLAGANIYILGTTIGAASDKSGEFVIKNISEGKYQVRISYSGFETVEKSVEIHSNFSNFIVQLQPARIDLNAVTVTGTRTEKTLKNTPVLTRLINKSEIETQAVSYIPQILAQQDASLEMYKDNTVSSLSLEGLGAKYVLFLLDGERLSGETKGAIDFARINPANIERIEIVKGAASTLYGSNAIGGIVNILTPSVSRPLEIKAGVQTSIYTDPSTNKTRNDPYSFAAVNLRHGKWASFSDFKFNHYAPYDLSAGKGINELLTQEKENNFLINQKLIYQLNKKLTFSGKASYYQLNRNYQKDAYPDKLSKDFSWNLKGLFFASPKAKYELSYYWDKNQSYDLHTPGQTDKILDYDNLFTNLRLLSTLKVLRINTLVAGAEYVFEKQSSLQNGIDEKTLNSKMIYAQDEIRLLKEVLSIVAGARMEFHSSFGNHFTPQISVMWQPDNFKFRASYGQGFRAPTAKELYTKLFNIPSQGAPFPMYLLGNENLKPEKSNYYSASVQYTTRKVDLSAGYSINKIANLINSDVLDHVVMNTQVTPPVIKEIYYKYQNVSKSRISAFNLLAKYLILDNLSLTGSYTFLQPKNLDTKNDLLNVRKHNARVSAEYSIRKGNFLFKLNASESYFGSKTVTDLNNHDPKVKTPTIKLNDFMLLRVNGLLNFKNRYTLNAGIDNLLNVIDKQPQYFNLTSPGRTVILGVSFSF